MPNAAADPGAEVARRIAAGEPCWFPGLAAGLVGDWWRGRGGSGPAGYTTAGWLGEVAPRVLPVPGWPAMVVEPLPAAFVGRFADAGVDDASAVAVGAALAWLPADAAAAVAALVRSVHRVEPRGRGYDCSHSEPGIPFSVFVSIPHGERDAGLRLAESLLHEAMHLQLTLVERRAPLVAADAGVGHSPWQGCERPVQGLLHGLYVFAAIHRWLTDLAVRPGLPADARRYVVRRLAGIGGEVAEVAALASHPGLNRLGRDLARYLLDGVADAWRGMPRALPSQAEAGASGGR